MALNWRGDTRKQVASSEFNYAGSYAIAFDGMTYRLAHIDSDGSTHDLRSSESMRAAHGKAEKHHLSVIKAHHKKLFG